MLLVAAAFGAGGLGLHLYTLPTRASGGIAAIVEFLGDAPLRESLFVPRRDPSPQAAAWLAEARRRDSLATVAWASSRVLAYATRRGDTSTVTLWRLAPARGCPLVSRLRGTVVLQPRKSGSYYQVLRIEANCPRPAPVR